MHFRQNLHLVGKPTCMKASIFAFFALLLSVSFTSKQLEGRWEYIYNDGTNAVYAKTSEYPKGAWLDFDKDGSLSVRKNGGWCGTPPISYKTYEGGSYTLTKHGKLTMISEFWGGIDTIHYQIASISVDTMRMRYLGRGGG